mmetsp:Transcript_33466/g.92692  ORF Transcript_33466/g.92692 Transcript_33466/m.92692 type:complete len:84 (-) Transcript_33466:1041-1292(-)
MLLASTAPPGTHTGKPGEQIGCTMAVAPISGHGSSHGNSKSGSKIRGGTPAPDKRIPLGGRANTHFDRRQHRVEYTGKLDHRD